MTNSPTPASSWRALTGGVIIGCLLLGTATFIQHWRHGWPFSLHHNISTAAANTASIAAGPPPATHNESRVAITLGANEASTIGLRTEKVQLETISQPLRVVTTVVPDESRVSHVHARVAGWLEQLYINTTGQSVKAGEALAGIFSQDLFATQTEYLSALKTTQHGPQSEIVEGAKARLKVLGMSEHEIDDIRRSGTPHRLVTITAPHSGVVLQRGVTAGTAVDPSTTLLTVADLSRVWIWAEVPETGARQMTLGTVARLEFPATGRAPEDAKIDFIYPTLTERTRTLRVRFSASNSDGSLRPGVFGTANFHSEPRRALMISRDAVVDTGLSQHVFIAHGDNHFEPRKVTLGIRLPDRIEVVTGLAEGDEIVASGVFLLDSESRLRASGGAGTGHSGHGNPQPAPETQPSPTVSPTEAPMPDHSGHGG